MSIHRIPGAPALWTVLLLAVAIMAPVAAQDDPDEEIYHLFADPRDRAAREATLLDMDIDNRGFTVMAFVEDSYYQPRVLVVSQDPTGRWQELSSFMPPANRGKIVDLAVAVGSDLETQGNNRAFVVVQYEAVPGSQEHLELYNGPVDTPWPRGPKGVGFASVLPENATSPAVAADPSIAVIPRFPGNFREYAVGITWTKRTGGPEGERGVMLTLFENEIDRRFNPPVRYWSYATHAISGPSAQVPAVQGDYFGRASLTADFNNGLWAAALDDTQAGHITVISGRLHGTPFKQPVGQAEVFTTPTGLHHPTLLAKDGETSLTALGRANRGGFALEWFFGVLWQPGSFIGLPTIHDTCRSKADIAAVRGDGFVTADCRNGEGWAVHAFQGERDDPGFVMPQVWVNDLAATPGEPRVVLRPNRTAIYGWTTGNAVPYGAGPPSKALYIDP
ncbi:hypothetical protein ABI59_00720 [Acidobacteria bacterium Mor1]|nr:hypothetical protein ABI59_00720 [Acidobacteria bacterium Mor1]